VDEVRDTIDALEIIRDEVLVGYVDGILLLNKRYDLKHSLGVQHTRFEQGIRILYLPLPGQRKFFNYELPDICVQIIVHQSSP